MDTLAYFNIGFRCENIREELQKYKDGLSINHLIIDDSKSIVADCFKVQDKIASSLSSSGNDLQEWIPVVLKYFSDKTLPQIIASLKKIGESLESISVLKSGVETKEAIDFFNGLAVVCLQQNKAYESNYVLTDTI